MRIQQKDDVMGRQTNTKDVVHGSNGYTYYAYEADRDVLAQVRSEFGGTTLSQYDYVTDAAGRRTEIARSGTAMSETRSDAYGYNDRNELVSASKLGGPQSPAAEYAYQYDDIGNRITSTDLTTNRTYTANSLNQYSAITTSDFGLQTSSFEPQFDDDGIFAEGYAYDALGRRAATTTREGTTRHVYDEGWQVGADIDEQGNVVASYTWGAGIDRLLAVKVGGESYYPLTDIQGTVWGYVDSSNVIVARWQYDAWGNVVEESVSVPALAALRYRFQGREWSAATGLINFRMRWYDSETGRWLSKDPIGLSGGLNLYAFCGNQPVTGEDKFGCVRGTVDGYRIEIHKYDVDPWPSKPHAHNLDNPCQKISKDGRIWDTRSKMAVGKVAKKALPRLLKLFAKATTGLVVLILTPQALGDSEIHPWMTGPPGFPDSSPTMIPYPLPPQESPSVDDFISPVPEEPVQKRMEPLLFLR